MKRSLLSYRLLVSLCLSISTLVSPFSFSQVAGQWIRFFDDMPDSWNQARALVADEAGNVYVTGESSGNYNWDIVTIKYNSSGNQEWAARYDGFQGVDYPTGIAIDKAGNIYVTGGSEGNGTLDDVVTIKYNYDGVQQWVARYNGPDNSSEHAFGHHGVKVDNNGNVYVLGVALAKNKTEDYLTIKYNSQGMQLWVQCYNGPGDGRDWPFAMALDTVTGDVYVTGFTGLANSARGYATVKYNSAGVEQWVRWYNDYLNGAVAIGLDSQGNVYVTGYSSFASVSSCVTIKYDASGIQKWTARYKGPATAGCEPVSLAVDRSGNVYITGSFINQLGSFTLKYNCEGVQQWVQLQSVTGSTSEGRSVSLDDEGNVYVTGYTDGSSAHVNRDYTTVKYNPDGVQLWVERYDGSGSSDDPVDIAVNKFHDVFVTGTSARYIDSQHINFHYLTVKYFQSKPLSVTASPDTTVYYGYGSNCVQLRAQVSGGKALYNFNWSPGQTNTSNPTLAICPTATTTYTVSVKDANETTAMAQVTVKVIDVRCGSNNTKVLVCHKGKELCIASAAVKEHLQHGDILGSCEENKNQIKKYQTDKVTSKGIDFEQDALAASFKNYPNPVNNTSIISYIIPSDAFILIKLFRLTGEEIMTIVQEKKKAGSHSALLDAKNLIAGTYLCRIVVSSKDAPSTHTMKITVIK